VDTIRIQRVNELIKRELLTLFKHKISDPRFQSVRITDVQTSRDLGQSKVFYSINKDAQKTTKLLNSKQGFFRHLLAKNIQLRHTPSLKFIYDDTPISSARIDELLDTL
jgi:ribosome-binding factor A